jgi:hypothetical protein
MYFLQYMSLLSLHSIFYHAKWIRNELKFFSLFLDFKGIFQPFELGAETSLIRSAVKFFKAGHFQKIFLMISREELKTN